MTKTKRPDIQGIRGLAIASVLAFHLNGRLFPAGFVGVDMFFVLSGYLMSSILARETTIDVKVLLSFYTRRFKRIVPLYSILLITLFVLVPLLLLRRDVSKFVIDSKWAAAFSTNIHSLQEKSDYFAELYDSNVLTHTWSLGVEIQYYLIVPFLITMQRLAGDQVGKLYLLILIAASFSFQCFSSATISFNAMSSRVWQFLAGAIAHELISLLSDQTTGGNSYSILPSSDTIFILEEERSGTKVTKEIADEMTIGKVISRATPTLLTVLLLTFSLFPVQLLPNEALRAVTIALTAAIIVLGRVEDHQSLLLTNRTSTTVSSIFVAVIYGVIICSIHFHLPEKLNGIVESKIPSDVADALIWNLNQSHPSYYRQRPFEGCDDDPEGMQMRDGYTAQSVYECLWKSPNRSGTVKILVVGNSMAHRATKLIHSIIENKKDVKEMRLFAHSACRPTESCPAFFEAMMKLVQRMQPDITFLIYDGAKRLQFEPIENIETDEPLADFVEFLKPLSANSKYLVLDEFYPTARTPTGVATSMYKRLLRGQQLDDLKQSYTAFSEYMSLYFRRIDQLPARFPNLIRHNTSAPLCAEEQGWCWWYNRRNFHAYFTDNAHLTADGRELLRGSYSRIIDDLIRRVKIGRNTTV